MSDVVSFQNPHYSLLAKQALAAWKEDSTLASYYHETGFVLASRFNRSEGEAYLSGLSRQKTVQAKSREPFLLRGIDSLRKAFPAHSLEFLSPTLKGVPQSCQGQCNPAGGWAEAGAATNAALDDAKSMGVEVVGNVDVTDLIVGGRKHGQSVVEGIVGADGRQFFGDVVILAPGAWLTDLLRRAIPKDQMWDYLPEGPSRAAGQTVMTFQLTSEMAARYASTPVVLDFSTGFYVFPPNKNGIVKCAIHGPGYRSPAPGKLADDSEGLPSFGAHSHSRLAPRTLVELGSTYRQQAAIEEEPPEETESLMRTLLREVWPEIADLPDCKRKICWYADSTSQDENWIVDWHPSFSNLFVVAAGSGHGFKVSQARGLVGPMQQSDVGNICFRWNVRWSNLSSFFLSWVRL